MSVGAVEAIIFDKDGTLFDFQSTWAPPFQNLLSEIDEGARAAAAEALGRAYPGREIVQLNVDALGLLGGGIHCATQQMPAS